MQSKDFEQLQDYLWGRLGPEARSELEARLAVEPPLQQALEHERMLVRAMQGLGDRRLKASLQDEERFLHTQSHMRPKWRLLKVAASILFLVSLGLMWSLLRAPEASTTLFASYFEPYPNVVAPLERAERPDTPLEQVMADYEAADYRSVIPGLDSLRRQAGEPTLAFYQAIALLATAQQAAALPLLQTIPPDHRFYWEGRWYQALAQLANGDKTAARTSLKDVATHGGFKATEAAQLLQEL